MTETTYHETSSLYVLILRRTTKPDKMFLQGASENFFALEGENLGEFGSGNLSCIDYTHFSTLGCDSGLRVRTAYFSA